MRKHYLDNIRYITVILVVFYHVFYMYNAEGILGGLGKITDLDVQYYDLFMYIVYPWMMPLLFIVSGISSKLYLDKHSEKEFLRSRTQKLLVPSTVGLFVFQFIQGYISMALGDAFATIQNVPGPVKYLIMVLSGSGVLWYIQLLWVLSVLLVLIRRIEKDRLQKITVKTGIPALVLLYAAVWASAQILNTPVIIVYRFGFYGMMFLTGYYIFSHDEVIGVLKKNCFLFTAAAAVTGILFCRIYFPLNFADAPVNRSLLFTAYAWSACLAFLSIAAKYLDFESRFTKLMKKRSFGLYIFHYLGISACALFIAKPGILPPAAVYPLSLAAGFLAGWLLYEVIRRIPFLRWAVLGITKEKDHV
ncbi:MAG: acyltransferase [Solobacterium sp.]|nr:acyltransferase [Solobacterium sp.]